MGYTTEFQGSFKFNKPLDLKTKTFLNKFAGTRRMARKVGPEFGVEGEFYVDGGDGEYGRGQGHDDNIISYNEPPCTQPSLWCQWVPDEDGTCLLWDGVEKFSCYVEWLQYLVEDILAPCGYSITGRVEWRGEEFGDRGTIDVVNNKITVIKL